MEGTIILIAAILVAIAMIAIGERTTPERDWERSGISLPDRSDLVLHGRLRIVCPDRWNPYREALEA